MGGMFAHSPVPRLALNRGARYGHRRMAAVVWYDRLDRSVLEIARVIDTPEATHIRYRVRR